MLMWNEFIAPALLVVTGVAGVGWFKTSRILHTTTREREDLVKSTLVIEVERRCWNWSPKGASLHECSTP